MVDKAALEWKEVLLLLASAMGICIGTNTFIVIESLDTVRDQFQREDDLIRKDLEFLFDRVQSGKDTQNEIKGN